MKNSKLKVSFCLDQNDSDFFLPDAQARRRVKVQRAGGSKYRGQAGQSTEGRQADCSCPAVASYGQDKSLVSYP